MPRGLPQFNFEKEDKFLQPQRKIRPLTAGPGRTGEHRNSLTTLYSIRRPQTATGNLVGDRYNRPLLGRPSSMGGHRPVSAWKERESIKHQIERQRRLTIGDYENVHLDDAILEQKERIEEDEESPDKIEDKLQYADLEKIQKLFEEAESKGQVSLNRTDFKEVVRTALGLRDRDEELIEALFMKIDSQSEEVISWDKFCSYMQLEYAEKEDAIARQRQVTFNLPPLQEVHQHRETVFKICNSVDRTFLSVSQDGMMIYWTPQLEIKRIKHIMTEQNVNRAKPKWITDFAIMGEFNKFIISTGDRELQFYELSTFEAYCQISSLETVPLKLDYCCHGTQRGDECLLLYGDGQGCVHIIIFHNAGETLRTWKKSKSDGIASVTIDAVVNDPNTKYIRWQVHRDWVTELKYFSNIRQVISSSNHDDTALVIGCTVGSTDVERELKEGASHGNHRKSHDAKDRLPCDKLEFRVYKGVKTFDFDKDKNILVTGGMDRVVRIFNPYLPSKPNGLLKGHNAPIVLVTIAAADNRIFSVSADKMIKVWDTQDQSCLVTLRPKSHQVRGDLQAVHYSQPLRALIMAADNRVALLQIKARAGIQGDIPLSHRSPVTCAGYNKAFNQIISCSQDSVVKVWDFRTGQQVFEFSKAHGDPEDPVAITCMTFDETYRRLITGGRDGIIKVWNYNNGNCLKKLVPASMKRPTVEGDFVTSLLSQVQEENPAAENAAEISKCIYININKTKKVISVGWDRRINIFLDSGFDFRIEQYPEESWQDDLQRGHKEDITAVTLSKPNLLATASYDGVVIIWNIISGRTLGHLISPPIDNYRSESPHKSVDGDMSINSLLFIQKRNLHKDAASLIASGPRGHIHFWNIYKGGQVFGRFPVSDQTGVSVTAMDLTKDDKHLFTADSIGYVRVWNVKTYCTNGLESGEPPDCEIRWRAHVESITTLQLVENKKMLITSSTDFTVRLWTVAGEYVGTFGQSELWDIFCPESFAHPHVPYDVLVDPASCPGNESGKPKEEDRLTFYEFVMQDQGLLDEEELKEARLPRTELVITDRDIAEEIAARPYLNASGKRLRHERHKPRVQDRGGPNAHQNLTCFDMEECPQKINAPNWQEVAGADPFAHQTKHTGDLHL